MKNRIQCIIEKNGTGIERTFNIEKNGTGIRQDASAIQKNRTGIKFGRILASACLAFVLAAPALAADFKGFATRSHDRLTISLTDGSTLLSGNAQLTAGYSVITLDAVDVSAGLNSEGNGTGVSSEGNGTGSTKSEGNGTGATKSEGNGTGGTQSEGNGTGETHSEGNDTGVSSEGNGTGVSSEGNGTGVSSEGNGTGVSSEGNGTGVARFCLAQPGVRSEGNGTGDTRSEGNGTGDTKSEGNGTGDTKSEGNGTGGTQSEGNGTGGTQSEGNGTGEAQSEGNGTGVSSEGNGTGLGTGARDGGLVITPIGGDLDAGRDAIPDSGCNFETVTLSWGVAEVALNANTASVLLYGVRSDGTLFELAAMELPVIVQ